MEQLAIIPVSGVYEAIQVPEVTYYVISNGMRAVPPMLGWGLSPFSKDKWIEEPNVGVGFIPILQGQSPSNSPLKGEKLTSLIPSIHVQ